MKLKHLYREKLNISALIQNNAKTPDISHTIIEYRDNDKHFL